MQVISGAAGREKIHVEAPPSKNVPAEMAQFIQWFNDTAPGGKKEIRKAPVRAAFAHLYFESIHPFEDVNGRIGTAVAEKALSQTPGTPVLLSLSETIEQERKKYYTALEIAQQSNVITPWMNYFVTIVLKAQQRAIKTIKFTLQKTRFSDRFSQQLNERQVKIIRAMLGAGPGAFIGGMTAKKYMFISKTSKATATRDLQTLSDLKMLVVEGTGRNTRYVLNMKQQL